MLAAPLRVAEREWYFFKLTWRGTAFSTFVAPLLLLLALGVGLGELVRPTDSLGGLEYLEFVAPGLLIAGVTQTAAATSLWPIMAGHKWIGFHRALVAAPIEPSDIQTGYLAFLAARAAATAAVFVAVATLLGGVGSAWAPMAIGAAALTAVAFAGPLTAYAMVVDSDIAFDPIVRLVVTPLYLFSGAVFPISELPSGIAIVAKVFPMFHGIELARSSTTGQWHAWETVVHIAVLLAWSTLGLVWGRRAFTARLAP